MFIWARLDHYQLVSIIKVRPYQSVMPAYTHYRVTGPSTAPDAAGQTPHRYASLGNDHSIIIVDMPEMKDILKAVADEMSASAVPVDETGLPIDPDDVNDLLTKERPLPLPQELVSRSLPLLFVRGCDGVGYHSGRTIALDNVFAQFDIPHGPPGVDGNWMSTAQPTIPSDIDSGWTLRVL
jgi:recombining binding protein (suppressor of hairless)